MAEIVKTSVTVDYAGTGGGPRIVLEQDNIVPPRGHGLARLYFAGATPTVLSTSGYPVYTTNTGVTSEEVRSITFTGTNTANFPVPNIRNVKLDAVGRFITPEGVTLPNIKLRVDATSGVVSCDMPVYGTVMATFTTIFNRLQCQFLKLVGADKDPRYVSEYADMILTAIRPGDDTAHLTLHGPSKGGAGYGPDDKGQGEYIVLEIDDRYPIRLSGTTKLPGLVATCRVWAYSTHGGLSFEVSQGVCEGDRYNLAESLPIKETLNFVHAATVSVSRPPANGIAAKAVGPVSSRNTPGSNFNFAVHPHELQEAQWRSYGFYAGGDMRRIGNNEIAAHTSGILVPVTGQVEAKYNTRRTWCDVYWSKHPDNEWFQPVVLTATDAYGNAKSLVLNPPERRGR